MMASFSCLVSFSSLISKLEHDQLFRASYATGDMPVLPWRTRNACTLPDFEKDVDESGRIIGTVQTALYNPTALPLVVLRNGGMIP